MTDREKAIMMAYTGVCMLTGDKYQVFHKYVEEIMGAPVYTHQLGFGSFSEELKRRATPDFMKLCNDTDITTKWIPVSDRLPEESDVYFVTVRDEDLGYTTANAYYLEHEDRWALDDEWLDGEVVAWMPQPEAYKPESEVEK